ncbi:MAG: phosphohistidine phosphatase SixA [Aigarchaeota archaeon]|nr:phosphohistidine phosphatase SixA [Aigarchaeota archaeon]
MKLYLVQHAEAKGEEEDPARPLSEMGWKDLEKVTSFLRKRGIEIARILHSGKLRARQTAEKLSEVVRSSEDVQENEGLAPLDDPAKWENRLKEETADVMLVGHLPHLSKLAGLLLTGDSNRRVINFKMGGVVCLERDEKGSWSVGWMIIPQVLR